MDVVAEPGPDQDALAASAAADATEAKGEATEAAAEAASEGESPWDAVGRRGSG